ncbi:hypothetical protein [Croceimicrobium sp.]|uniref:hypothetical protein n=1 Tax=Croceimicrobium sp. TaxID=2828340 RepID=UPI003BAD8650
MRKYLHWALLPLFMACQNTVQDKGQKLSFAMTGDMLFAGANTLQGKGEISLQNLAENIDCEVEAIKSVKVSAVKVGLTPAHQKITESVLLQVLSDNVEMASIGTLNPVPDSGVLELNLAEDVDLKPYLQDKGMTWVLDINISEDHMDVMPAKGEVQLLIDYTDSK